MRLAVNGDDLGYTRANTLGILQAFRQGILRSTTALMNAPYAEWARDLAVAAPGLGVGVHLTLTLGRPLTDGRTLVGEDGAFLPRAQARVHRYDPEEVYAEWEAQVECFIGTYGCLPTHLDSHHGVHDMNPQMLAVARRLADRYGLPLRRQNDRFACTSAFTGSEERATAENLLRIIEDAAEVDRDTEIVCHPGYCDLELYRASSYNLARVRELDVLCDERVLARVHELGVELVSYRG